MLKYNWLVTTDSWKELIALRNGLKNAGRNFFALSDPVQHYLTHTGRTLFKQLPFEELKRMQIEVLSFAGEAISRRRPTITSRASRVSDNTGWEELIEVDPRAIEESEHAAIKRLTSLIKERDPGRDRRPQPLSSSTCRFSSPGRARRRRNSIGDEAAVSSVRARRGSRSRRRRSTTRSSRSRAGILSTPFCSRNFTTSGCVRFPASSEAMSRSTLAYANALDVSQLSGKELQRAWQDDPKRYRERALCAVRETRAVADLLSPSYFIQAQIFPYNYQDVIVRGNATRINALFLREYFRQRHGIPEMPMVRGFEGGYTDIFFTGVARNVWHCDIASLYPSIMLQFDCFPVTDQLQIFRHLLTDLRTFRLAGEERHARRRRTRRSGATSTPCKTPSRS